MARRSTTINEAPDRLPDGRRRYCSDDYANEADQARTGTHVTDAHQFLGFLSVAATVPLLAVSGWSAISSRRSAGAFGHRFAVDRLVLVVVALLATNGLLGLLVLGVGGRPADALHLLYGPAALACLPVGVWLGRRGEAGVGAMTRRREAWLVGATIVLLGVELRLFMTG
jgi:hypothetical protein